MENHPEIRFAALYHADNAVDHTNCKEAVTGLIMSEHWDCSDQAGSKSRGRAAFGEPLPSLETLAVVDGEVKTLNNQLVVHQSVFYCSWMALKDLRTVQGSKTPSISAQLRIPDMVQQKLTGQQEFLKRCLDDIAADTKFTTSLKSWHASSATPTATTSLAPSGPPAERPPRTLGTPEWGSDGPWNFRRAINGLESMPAVDFEPLNPPLRNKYEKALLCGKVVLSIYPVI